jgi:hypothetical protein
MDDFLYGEPGRPTDAPRVDSEETGRRVREDSAPRLVPGAFRPVRCGSDGFRTDARSLRAPPPALAARGRRRRARRALAHRGPGPRCTPPETRTRALAPVGQRERPRAGGGPAHARPRGRAGVRRRARPARLSLDRGLASAPEPRAGARPQRRALVQGAVGRRGTRGPGRRRRLAGGARGAGCGVERGHEPPARRGPRGAGARLLPAQGRRAGRAGARAPARRRRDAPLPRASGDSRRRCLVGPKPSSSPGADQRACFSISRIRPRICLAEGRSAWSFAT